MTSEEPYTDSDYIFNISLNIYCGGNVKHRSVLDLCIQPQDGRIIWCIPTQNGLEHFRSSHNIPSFQAILQPYICGTVLWQVRRRTDHVHLDLDWPGGTANVQHVEPLCRRCQKNQRKSGRTLRTLRSI